VADDDIQIDTTECDALSPAEQWALQETTTPGGQPLLPREALVKVLTHRMMSFAALHNLPAVEWFIGGLVPEGAKTVLAGPGGSRKSFIALDWALSAANGVPWCNRPVKPGKVLYIAGEGVGGMAKRVDAWAYHRGFKVESLQGVLMPRAINLWSVGKDAAHWAEVVAHLAFDYIVVDTLHTSMAGGDENKSQDIGTVYENATTIAGNAKLIFVHHSAKATPGQRGSSAIHDDADVVINVLNAGDRVSKLKAVKLKDADNFKDLAVHFKQWNGAGIDGSLYITHIDDSFANIPGPARSGRDAAITRVERCAMLISEHDLGNLSVQAIRKALADGAGEAFGTPTVGKAKKLLATKEIEVEE